MSRDGSQLMLWVTEVTQAGDGRAVVTAKTPAMEGGIEKARKALGGPDVVSRDDVYTLLRLGYIKARKNNPGRKRKDGRASNTKWIFDLVSCASHKRRMEKAGQTAHEDMLPSQGSNCDLFGYRQT